MNDFALTQLGLFGVYVAVGVLLTLTERVERSKALRIWTVTFFLFALDAGASALREIYSWPASTRAISWVALTGAGLAGVAGTIAFIGKALPRGLFVLGGIGIVTTLAGFALGLDLALIRAIVFVSIGLSFLWSAKLTLEIGVSPGVGRWVGCSAFVGAGLYAISWPLICQFRGFDRVEFFLDFSLVMWGAAGALLIHFERSRERIRTMAAQELELRAQLERSERLEALGRLAGGVAHDFNNVLTTVIHGSELALRQLGDRPKTAAHIEVVLEAARGAASFTRQLLALGRHRLPGRKPVRVDAAIRGAMSMVRPTLLPNHELNCPAVDSALAVLAGEGQLEQIVVNLSLNALDAMPNGGMLELRIESEPNLVRLLVRDTGYGMDEETVNRVFEPFFSRRSSKGGTGLGLTAVYAIVQQLDGKIHVHSSPGSGSSFVVELPRCEPPPTAVAKPSRSSRPPSTVRILLVDDQESVLHTLSAGLSKTGYQVTTATCAEEALKILRRELPTLLLADVRMPGISGLDLVAMARQVHPQLPVIMMTGHANDEEIDSEKYGAQWLLKPFTTQKLNDAIDSALS